MRTPNLVSDITPSEVVALLSSPQVSARLEGAIGEDVRAIPLSRRGDTYRVSGSNGDFIVRFAANAARFATLRKEERIGRGLKGRVNLLIPEPRLLDGLDKAPAFAIHRMIPGEPLTTDIYLEAAPPVQERLIEDLARFFRQTHAIPLETACEWLGVPFAGARTIAELATRWGKPTWFDPPAVREMRPLLEPLLDGALARLFEDTVCRFVALPVDPRFLIFGHGDMHGYNVAVGADSCGMRIAGVFDLECAGILDIHEDLFRLSLVSEEMLERVIAAYHARPGSVRRIDRTRIAIYYRAFLYHLMVGKVGEQLAHLKRLLHTHLDRWARRAEQTA